MQLAGRLLDIANATLSKNAVLVEMARREPLEVPYSEMCRDRNVKVLQRSPVKIRRKSPAASNLQTVLVSTQKPPRLTGRMCLINGIVGFGR